LRERAEDIPVLAQHFMRRYATESKKDFLEIRPDAMARLSAYPWPGNVRELANTIERAVVLGRGPAISTKDLPDRIKGAEMPVAAKANSYRQAMDAARRELVSQALVESNGNRAAAAKALGLHEKYFLRLIKTLGIT
jgi:two-component system response regulator AtoC